MTAHRKLDERTLQLLDEMLRAVDAATLAVATNKLLMRVGLHVHSVRAEAEHLACEAADATWRLIEHRVGVLLERRGHSDDSDATPP